MKTKSYSMKTDQVLLLCVVDAEASEQCKDLNIATDKTTCIENAIEFIHCEHQSVVNSHSAEQLIERIGINVENLISIEPII